MTPGHTPPCTPLPGQGPGVTLFGDVWVAAQHHYKIPLEGNPTRCLGQSSPPPPPGLTALGTCTTVCWSGLRRTWALPLQWPSMAFLSWCGGVGGRALTMASNQGPNDAGDVSIDEAGFQLACGGHVTPPTTNLVLQLWPLLLLLLLLLFLLLLRMIILHLIITLTITRNPLAHRQAPATSPPTGHSHPRAPKARPLCTTTTRAQSAWPLSG